MDSHCPACGTDLHVKESFAGRQIACNNCHTRLNVAVDGLHQVSPEEAPAAAAGNHDVAAASGFSSLTERVGRAMSQIADRSTWFFGAGAFLVIMMLFFPMIDEAHVAHLRSKVLAGNLREAQADRELKDPTTDAQQQRKRGREFWQDEMNTLLNQIEEAEVTHLRSAYWYRYGNMIGFLLLVAGALGYLSQNQSTARRIVGGIVITAFVLGVFNSYSRLGLRLEVGALDSYNALPYSVGPTEPAAPAQKDDNKAKESSPQDKK